MQMLLFVFAVFFFFLTSQINTDTLVNQQPTEAAATTDRRGEKESDRCRYCCLPSQSPAKPG
jgi:hypothetical protein